MRRIVLKRNTPVETIEHAARVLGWLAKEVPIGDAGDVRVDYEREPGRRVRWVDDSQSAWSYLMVPGVNAVEWNEALAAQAAVVTRDNAFERFRQAQDKETLCDAILLLGLFANGPLDNEVFAALAAALLSISDEVKCAALTAITYSAWSEFGPVLRTGMAEAGASPKFLQEGREIADRMDAADWNRSYYASDS